MVELLSVLALATKQTKQGRFKKFAKKLLGESEIEAVLQRLDRPTLEDGRMTMAQTLEVVHGLMNNVNIVMNDGKASMDGIWRALGTLSPRSRIALEESDQGARYDAINCERHKQDQAFVIVVLYYVVMGLELVTDPSPNYNNACETHQDGTAMWFFQGSVFTVWNAKDSLLWIHGKPDSGKSRQAGLASMAYFYFDFRDNQKQHRRGPLSSLLSQLNAESNPCHHIPNYILLTLGAHDNLPMMPCCNVLLKCLKSKDSPRLARSSTSELLLNPLTPFRVSFDDETGQKADILAYIKSVVHSDRRMRYWSTKDKQLVISTLSNKADGMFRWVYCQLEIDS
ncbi:hypothetical protein EDB87DRAFT_1576541 [Lactarius vividus]|nr:hypothetical protein EDB87DRAFT_1576541 [Lactarius vividus]